MAESLRKPDPVTFDSSVAENWRNFEEEFEIYTEAVLYDKTPKVKAYTLLNLAGSEAIKRSKNFEYAPEVKNDDGDVITAAETKEDHRVLLQKFRNLCNPLTNVSMERHLFFTRDQKQGESVESYITELRSKANSCEFAALKDSLLRDRFISGVQSANLRRVLLKERNLTLSRTIELAQLDELTQTRLKQFTNNTSSSGDTPSKAVDIIETNQYQMPARSSNNKACSNCGYEHRPGACLAQGKQCHNCLRYNHFARYCRSPTSTLSARGTQFSSQSRGQSRGYAGRGNYRGRPFRRETPSRGRNMVHEFDMNRMAQDQEDEETYFLIEALEDENTEKKEEIFANLILNNVKVELKVDTGAKCNVLNMELASHIASSSKQPLKVDKMKKVKLIAYGGDSFYTKGTVSLRCQHGDSIYELTFHIVDKPVKSLLGLPDSMRLKLMHFSSDIHELSTILAPELEQYSDLFDNKLGKLPVRYKISMDQKILPVVRPARRIPLAMKDRVKQELDSMEQDGVVSQVNEPTEWVSNMVAAKKKNKDEIRLCIDPKDLNMAIRRPHHHLKTVDEVLGELPNAKVFSVLDAKSSFWQICLDENSSKITTFATPFGRYKFNRLPYGIIAGSEVFQKTMDELFDQYPCNIIVDDILVWGEEDADHDRKLKSVLDRCREINLKLNPKKCKFRVTRVPYVGHILTDKGVLPDPDKVRAIDELPIPNDIKALQRFLGMVNYLAKFIKGHSDLTAPLRELLHKGIEFLWLPRHTEAFEKIKSAIAVPTSLQYYNLQKEVTITCDASKLGLGGACLQEGQPIHYISRALTETEQNYAQIEKELLAVVFSCEKFKHYIYGRPVTIETDHQPLITIFKKSLNQAPTRLQKMLMRLQGYDINLVYKKGKDIPTASIPEIIVFHSVASEVLVTRGMSRGLSHPTINIVSPKRKRHPAFG